MRIISGKKKGAKLIEFKGEGIRPTTDRVKESLFNLIQEFVLDANVLDLFAGSGALCFEAISRGARHGVCTDISNDSIAVIRKNLDKLGFLNEVSVIKIGAEDYLRNTTDKFDIIFMDPPYNKGFIEPALEIIVSGDILSDCGIVVVESDSPDEVVPCTGLAVLKMRQYGRTNVTVFTKETV